MNHPGDSTGSAANAGPERHRGTGRSETNLEPRANLEFSGIRDKVIRDAVALTFKTTLCTSFAAAGQCRYEGACQFAHGEHELRE